MTTREVAARLGVSTVPVRQLARMGRLPDFRRGRACLYSPQDVEAFARIPRPPGVSRGRDGGGAPRGNFNHLTTSGRQGRLHAVRRHLPRLPAPSSTPPSSPPLATPAVTRCTSAIAPACAPSPWSCSPPLAPGPGRRSRRPSSTRTSSSRSNRGSNSSPDVAHPRFHLPLRSVPLSSVRAVASDVWGRSPHTSEGRAGWVLPEGKRRRGEAASLPARARSTGAPIYSCDCPRGRQGRIRP